jgi:hypothetical protein
LNYFFAKGVDGEEIFHIGVKDGGLHVFSLAIVEILLYNENQIKDFCLFLPEIPATPCPTGQKEKGAEPA